MTLLDEMIATFHSQCRNMDQHCILEVEERLDSPEGQLPEAVVVVHSRRKSKRFLLVGALNVSVCQGRWGSVLLDRWLVGAVQVSYGFSQRQGAIAEESQGNKHMDDYRRLVESDDLEELGNGVYGEAQCLCSEENLRRLFLDLPLLPREFVR